MIDALTKTQGDHRYTDAALRACHDIDRLLRELEQARGVRDENAYLMHTVEGLNAAQIGRALGMSTSRVRLAIDFQKARR